MTTQKTSPPGRPLHKDPSFWIIMVVVIGTLNFFQFTYGLPWFKQRLVAVQPAPRMPALAQNDLQARGGLVGNQQQPNLDYSKKTYPWQTPSFSGNNQNLPPQVIIIPSEYTPPSGGWSTWGADAIIGIRVPAQQVVQAAYNNNGRPRDASYNPYARVRPIFPPGMPSGQFDFFSNIPSNAAEALQKEIEARWGLIGVKETRVTNVFVLTVDHSDAPGLKPGNSSPPQPQTTPQARGQNLIRNVQFAFLPGYLENSLQGPVIDQTGLTGRYDIILPQLPFGGRRMVMSNGVMTVIQNTNNFEAISKILLDQYGLQVTPSNAPVEYLVIKKTGL